MDFLTAGIALAALRQIGKCVDDYENEQLDEERREEERLADEDDNDCPHCNRRRQREDDDDYECPHCGRLHTWNGVY